MALTEAAALRKAQSTMHVVHFLTTSPKIKRQDPHHSNRMFFLNTVVYDNFVHFQHCRLALARDGKGKKMSQTRDRKRCSPPLPTNKRATLKIAVYVNCVLTKPVCNLKF